MGNVSYCSKRVCNDLIPTKLVKKCDLILLECLGWRHRIMNNDDLFFFCDNAVDELAHQDYIATLAQLRADYPAPELRPDWLNSLEQNLVAHIGPPKPINRYGLFMEDIGIGDAVIFQFLLNKPENVGEKRLNALSLAGCFWSQPLLPWEMESWVARITATEIHIVSSHDAMATLEAPHCSQRIAATA